MADETIVAVYDTAPHADAAIRDLEAAKVPSNAISRHAGTTETTSGTQSEPAREQGFWASLFGGEPDHDSSVYDRSVDSGSTVVTVKVPSEHFDAVAAILEKHDPVDIEERAAGYATAGGMTTTTTRETVASAPAPAPAPAPAQAQAPAEKTTGSGEEVIALSEEQLAVGKRLVNRGTTRVRRFVVETPVEQDVTLQSEKVSIERRSVASNATTADNAFEDKVIEVTESGEEAVVGKSAHVREEVVVRKDMTDHVETVHDTVRREDVEITKDGKA